jgi:hypothetical protein
MPPGTPISRSAEARSRGIGSQFWAPIVAILAVFGCGRGTIDLAISRSNSHGDGGVEAGVRADAGVDSGSRESIACLPDGGCAFGVCIQETGRCGECRDKTDCKYGFLNTCDISTNACVECVGDNDCPPDEGKKCNTALRRCTVGCASDADCPHVSDLQQLSLLRALTLFNGFDRCDPQRMYCTTCSKDTDCSRQPRRADATLTCWEGACIECKTDGDCRAGRRCEPHIGQCL